MELLDEVLIKEVAEDGIDKVYILKNLPKRFIYTKVPKMVQRVDRDGYKDGTIVPDPSGEMVDGLVDGLEHSQTRDRSILFLMGTEPGRNAMAAVDAYVAGTLPRDIVLPKRVPYPIDPTDMKSQPRMREDIPVVELPIPEEKISRELPQVSPEAEASPAKQPRVLSEAEKERRRESLAKARAVAKARKEEAQK